MDIAFLLIYAVLLGLVFPYVGLKDERYGLFVPTAIATVFGAVVWSILIWLGFKDTEAWIWIITMATMPVAAWFGTKRLAKLRG